jgi:LysM repeat protein
LISPSHLSGAFEKISGKLKFFLDPLEKMVTFLFMKIRNLFFGVVFFSIASFAGAATYVVKSGDNFYRIAKNYGISLKQLEQANPTVSASSLRIGAKLVIPSRSDSASLAAAASSSTPAIVTAEGAYEVQQGDSLSKIARTQGTTVAALKAANPTLNPNKMAIGQKIQIPGSSAPREQVAATPAPAPTPVQQTTPEERSPETAPQPAPVQEKTSIAEIQNATQQTMPAPEPAPAPALAQADTETVKNTAPESSTPQGSAAYRLIKTTRELTLAEVAKENNTTTEKINALNGWSFSPQTLLAVDSELYIPAQP